MHLRRLTGILLLVFAVLSAPCAARANEGAEPLVSTTTGAPARDISVLFVGNSYVFVNDMPRMLVNIASSDPKNDVRFHVQSVAHAGSHLIDTFDDAEARAVMASQKWDYVILQEQSLWAMKTNWVKTSERAVTKWNHRITAQGGHTVLFETWARDPDSSWYTDPQYADLGLQSPQHMQQNIDENIRHIAGDLRIPVVSVGDYWALADRLPHAPDLYNEDGTHPSIAGTYLSALLFYRHFAGHGLEDVTYVPDGLTKAQTQLLQEVASR